MLKRVFVLATASLLLITLPAFGGFLAASAAGLPGHVSISGADLRMNGIGKRTLLGIDAYLCALYLPQRSTTFTPLLDPQMPKAISFRLLSDPMGNGLPDDLRRKLANVMAEPRLQRLQDLFGGLHQGDEVVLAYGPDRGTEMRINGTGRGVIDGHGMMMVFLDHWLGESPVSGSLRDSLLGRR